MYFGAAVLLEESAAPPPLALVYPSAARCTWTPPPPPYPPAGEQVISGGKVGTWTYWAPEQADASVPYDQQIDMWSVGVLLYIMLSGRHPFETFPGEPESQVMGRILRAEYSFDPAQWTRISGRAKQLVRQLLEPDPAKRLTAAQLLAHSWVRGEDVPERPLPDTVERLRAFKTASRAIHGSLLMAALLHQEDVKEQLRQGTLRASGSQSQHDKRHDKLRRSTTEGVGMFTPAADFNVVRAAWNLFDPEDKGHITSDDLQRVCHQLGYTITERDLENMLSVLAPSQQALAPTEPPVAEAGGDDRSGQTRHISFDKFARMMESSYRRHFAPGEAVFREGDAVDGFYIVVSGECSVQATTRPNTPPREIASLGPGDFFGETGLLEGRGKRNSTVLCKTSVEVLMMDKSMFLHLTEGRRGSAAAAIPKRMAERVAARQRSRLNRAIELMQSAPMQLMRFSRGDVLFRQGQPVSHFFIVKSGDLQSCFRSSTGEEAELGQLHAGDQFGYDAVLGELHDTTVRCLTDAEVLAVPREALQQGLTQETYLQSVWQAPAQRSLRLRRQLSQALHGNGDGISPPSPRESLADELGIKAYSQWAAHAAEGGKGEGGELRRFDSSAVRLPEADFASLLRRSRLCSLEEGEAAYEQGSAPTAVYLLAKGHCRVERTTKGNEGPTVVRELRPGEHFGDGALLEGRSRRSVSVRCADPAGCSVGVLSKGAFEATLSAEPALHDTFEVLLARRGRAQLRRRIREVAEREDCQRRTLAAGEILYQQGDPADAYYLVDSGSIETSFRASDGRKLPAHSLRMGEVFGGSGPLSAGSGARRNTATALEPTVLRVIPHARFDSLVRHDSLMAAALRRVATDVSGPSREAAAGSSAAAAEPARRHK